MNQRDLIRLTFLLVVLGLNAVLSHYAFEDSSAPPLLDSMRVGSYVVLIMALIITVQAFTCGKPREKQHLKLSMDTVVAHVYGLGSFVFVAVYCFLGITGDANVAFYTSLTVIGVDDILRRGKDTRLRRGLLFFCVLLAGVANICVPLQRSDVGQTLISIAEQRWFVVAFGEIIPFLAPWIFMAVRGKRFYSPVTVYDFLNFGMPFAVVIAFMVLVGLDFQRETDTLLKHLDGSPHTIPSHLLQPLTIETPRNDTNHTAAAAAVPPALADASMPTAMANASMPAALALTRLVRTSDIAIPLLALNMIPTVFLAIQCTLLYSTVDFMSCAAVAAVFRALWEAPRGAFTILAFVAASVGFTLRVYACFRDESDNCSVAYTREIDEDADEEEILTKLQHDIVITDA